MTNRSRLNGQISDLQQQVQEAKVQRASVVAGEQGDRPRRLRPRVPHQAPGVDPPLGPDRRSRPRPRGRDPAGAPFRPTLAADRGGFGPRHAGAAQRPPTGAVCRGSGDRWASCPGSSGCARRAGRSGSGWRTLSCRRSPAPGRRQASGPAVPGERRGGAVRCPRRRERSPAFRRGGARRGPDRRRCRPARAAAPRRPAGAGTPGRVPSQRGSFADPRARGPRGRRLGRRGRGEGPQRRHPGPRRPRPRRRRRTTSPPGRTTSSSPSPRARPASSSCARPGT